MSHMFPRMSCLTCLNKHQAGLYYVESEMFSVLTRRMHGGGGGGGGGVSRRGGRGQGNSVSR